MNSNNQIPFTFRSRTTFSRDDFLIASNNAEAIKWVESWPNWPSSVICIYGPTGCGKTHLSEVFRGKSKATKIDQNWLTQNNFLEKVPPELIIEDLSPQLSKHIQEKLFHLYNYINEVNGHILITATTPPAKWEIQLEDLKSRLNTAIVAEIKEPDDALMSAILVKMFSDRQLVVSNHVIKFAINNMERSFSAARELVEKADKIGLVEKRKISLSIIKKVLVVMKIKGDI